MKNSEILDYIKKSFELKNQGFYKPAIEMLYKALSLDGDNIEILAQLAHLYKLLRNTERTIYYVEKVLEKNDKHVDCLSLLEEIYLDQNNIEQARELSEKIYAIQPTSQNLATKIKILNKLNDFEKVKEIENSILDLNDEVLYEIAFAHNINNQQSKALELLELGYAKNNKNFDIMLLMGEIYYQTNDFERARTIFAELTKFAPTAKVMNYLGLFCIEEKKISEAIDYFQKAQTLEENNSEYAHNLASAYFLNGWFDEALKYFNKAIGLAPNNLSYHYSLAYLFYHKKTYECALKELDLIKKINPEHEPSLILNSMIIAQKGDLFSAKKQLDDIISNNKNDDFAYYALSQVERELSRLDSAKKAINHAIKIKPDSLEYLSELVEIELEQKQYDEALKLANKILKLNGKYVFALIAIAKINLEKGNYDKVYDAAQDIIELDSNSPEGYYYNALALFEQGDNDFAMESLKKAISLDLNNAGLYIKMSEFYQEIGDFKTAYEWAKEACEIDERNYKYKWLCAKLAATLKNESDAIKNYSKSYRLAPFDENLCLDYANYLKSIGKNKQAEKIAKV